MLRVGETDEMSAEKWDSRLGLASSSFFFPSSSSDDWLMEGFFKTVGWLYG